MDKNDVTSPYFAYSGGQCSENVLHTFEYFIYIRSLIAASVSVQHHIIE